MSSPYTSTILEYPTTDINEALSDIIPLTADLEYPGGYPGIGQEAIHVAAQAFKNPPGIIAAVGTDTPSGNIDYVSWGETGDVDRNAYSILGPVEPNTVEDHELRGQVLPGQRRPEYGNGPVGAYDHSGYTSMQVAQQMFSTAYDEASLVSILTGS